MLRQVVACFWETHKDEEEVTDACAVAICNVKLDEATNTIVVDTFPWYPPATPTLRAVKRRMLPLDAASVSEASNSGKVRGLCGDGPYSIT